MDNPESNELTRWTQECAGLLTPPADWEPDADAARVRFKARLDGPAPSRSYWLAGVALALLACLAVFAMHPARVFAQQSSGKSWHPLDQAWYWLTLVHTQPMLKLAGALPEDVKSLRTHAAAQGTVPEAVTDVSAAAQRVGFNPRMPQLAALSAKPRLSVTKPAVYTTDIDRAELQAALLKRKFSDRIPESWNRARITLNVGATVTAEWLDVADQWSNLTLVQGPVPVVAVPKGFDLAKFSAVNLRVTGWGSGEHADAVATLAKRETTLAALLYSRASDGPVRSIRDVDLGSGIATLIEDFGERHVVERVTLLWSVPGRAYALRGVLKEPLGVISPDLAGALVSIVDLANSI